MRVLSILILMVTIFAFASCGGGGGHTGPRLAPSNDAGQVSPVTPPSDSNERSREQELALLENLEPPEGVDLVLWNEMKAALAALLPEKIVSTPPIGEGKTVTDLDFFRDEEEAGGLAWSYQLQGDYNVDGVVNVDDLSAIAENYGEVIGEENAWLALLDFSGNGVIDIADVTGIALNYGFELGGFTIISGGPGFIDWDYISMVERSEAETLMGGVLLFSFTVEPEDWSDFAVLAQDNNGATGEMSNVLEYRQPRIISVDTPSGKVGDTYTVSAVVEGEEPFTYDWILTNGVSPNRSDEAEVEVELVQQGYFSGHLTVSNRFDERRENFSVVVGVPPAVSSVQPLTATCGERTPFSAQVTGPEPIIYDWDFGANAFPRKSTSVSPLVEFDDDGTHNCYLRVINEYGEFRFDFLVATGFIPQIVKVMPERGTCEQDVRLNAEVLGTGPFSYSWTMNYWAEPLFSADEQPLVSLTDTGAQLGKLVVTNDYGEATKWFSFYVGRIPQVYQVLWTTGNMGNMWATFFADVGGDFPMTYEWVFHTDGANGRNDQPMVGDQTSVWPAPPFFIPNELGEFDGEVTVTNEFGSDTAEFTVTVEELFIVPPPPG